MLLSPTMGQKTTNKLTEVSRKALDGAEACSAMGVSPQPQHSGRISECGVQVKHSPVAMLPAGARKCVPGRERIFHPANVSGCGGSLDQCIFSQARSSRVSTRGAIANSALSD